MENSGGSRPSKENQRRKEINDFEKSSGVERP